MADFLNQLDLIGELRELAQLVDSAEVDASLLGGVALYVLPLAWLMRRW